MRITSAGCIAMLVVAMLTIGGIAPLTAQHDPTQTRHVDVSDSLLDVRTRALAAQIRCPVCQGLSIQDSPSQLAQQMHDRVRQMLQEGKTPDDVKRYFVERYGAWALMEPPATGFNRLVYGLPVLALVGGVAVLILVLRRWTASPSASD